MEDPKLITDLATLGATAWASKELAGKLLGPTFDYVGGEVGTFVAKCNVNLTDIFVRARRKLRGKEETPGGVSPRVVKEVLEQGAFCDDSFAAEYIAGVLASSRSEDSMDDRGVAYLSVIRQLSRQHIRVHYLIYRSLRLLLSGKSFSALNPPDAPKMQIFLPIKFLRKNCGLVEAREHIVAQQIFNGLARNDLIGSSWWGGDATLVRLYERRVSEGGYFVTPTGFGVELFLWAHGRTDTDVAHFLQPQTIFEELPDCAFEGLPLHLPDLSGEVEKRLRETEAFGERTIAARRGF